MSASEAYAAALRLLTRREYGSGELAGRLRRKGFEEAQIAAALCRCRELGYLDDLRFARERSGALLRSGRAVGPRLLADLQQRGVEEAIARAAMDEAGREHPEERVLADLARRRFPDFRWQTADARERRRVSGYFLRRGFSLPLILSHFKEEER